MGQEPPRDNSRLPWFPFYFWDWESSLRVRQMGPTARAYYFHLLGFQFAEGSLPSDRESLKRILLMPDDPGGQVDREAALTQVLECFQPDDNGRLRNARMEVIRSHQIAAHRAKSIAGKAGRMKQLGAEPGQSPDGPGALSGQSPADADADANADTNADASKTDVRSNARKNDGALAHEDLAAVMWALGDVIPAALSKDAKALLRLAGGNGAELCRVISQFQVNDKMRRPLAVLTSVVKEHFSGPITEARKSGASAMAAGRRVQ